MLTTDGLMRLMTWLSPSFPVGAYTYSHGVEYAVEEGLVKSGDSLKDWIEGSLIYGAGHTDGMFFCEAWKRTSQNDFDGVLSLNEFAIAMRPTSEMALESEAQGRAFLSTVLDVSDYNQLRSFDGLLKKQDQKASYPVIVATAAALEGIECEAALIAYLHAFAANLVSAGVRLVPLGQTAGQKALNGLEEAVKKAAASAMNTDFEDIGSGAPVVDWTSFRHETQYSRMFRS